MVCACFLEGEICSFEYADSSIEKQGIEEQADRDDGSLLCELKPVRAPPLLAHVRLPPTVSLAKQSCSRNNVYAGQFGGLEARNIVQAISETDEASEPLGKDLDALGLRGCHGRLRGPLLLNAHPEPRRGSRSRGR